MVHWWLYLASGYAITSLFFFCFPNILHSKKQYKYEPFNDALNGKKILRISHRGGPRLTTENTKEAFKKVVHVSDMLEMDVCETKDKKLVVHHDQNLFRTCGVEKKVNEYNFKDLPPFKDEIQLDFSQEQTITSNNEKIPTLQEVFQLFQGVPMNIQLKTPTASSIQEFARLIYQYDRADITFCSIRNSMNQEFQRQNPTFISVMNDQKVYKVLLGFFLGVLPFMKIHESSLQIPVWSEDFYQWKLRTLDQKWKVKLAFGALSIINLISIPIAWHLRRRGIFTLTWVCNDEKSSAKSLKIGAQGIMTDEPFMLHEFLKQK